MSFFDKLKDTTKKLTSSIKERIEFVDVKEIQLEEHNFSNLVIKSFNGSVKIIVHDKKMVHIENNIAVLSTTQTETQLKEIFVNKELVRITDNSITLKANDDKNFVMDIKLSLPIDALKLLKFEGLNSRFSFNENGSIINIENIAVNCLNGKVQIEQVDSEETVIDLKSGDITFKGYANKLVTKTLNGKLHNELFNEREATVEAVTVNGSIYLAVAKEVGLRGKLNTNFGDLQIEVDDCEITDDTNQKLLKMKSVQKIGNEKVVFLCEARKGDVLVEQIKGVG